MHMQTMVARILPKSVRVALAAVALTGLAQGVQAQELRIWTFLDLNGQSGREVAFKQLVDKFEAEHDGVKIAVEPQDWRQLGNKFLAAHQTGTAPDLIWLPLPRIAAAIEAGTLANLDELFIKDWSDEELADVDGPFFQYKANPGEHYVLIGFRSQYGICYRADILNDANIKPQDLQTWDKFIAAAQSLMTRDADGNVTRWGLAQSFIPNGDSANIGMSTILQLQGNVVKEDGTPDWATDAGVRGVQLLVDMVKKYKITPMQAVSMSSDDVYDHFTAGRAVFARCASARVPNLAQALGDAQKVGYMATPSFTEGKWSPTEVGGWSTGVWAGSPNKQLAGEFLELMGSEFADALWVKLGGQIPSRKSTIEKNQEFFADPDNAYMVAVADNMANAGWFPPDNVLFGKNDAILQAVQQVLVNDASPMDALKQSEQEYSRANRL